MSNSFECLKWENANSITMRLRFMWLCALHHHCHSSEDFSTFAYSFVFFFSRTDSKTINNNAQQRSKTEWSTIVNPECDFVNCAMQNNRLINTQCLAWFTMFNVLLMLDRDTTLNINDWLRCQRRTIFKKFNILIEY